MPDGLVLNIPDTTDLSFFFFLLTTVGRVPTEWTEWYEKQRGKTPC